MKTSADQQLKPDYEKERLAKLYSYNIIDTYEQFGPFQHVASMAAHIFKTPIAFVNLVDETKIHIKASVGIEGFSEVKRELGLCSLAVLKDAVTVFKNTKAEKCLLSNSLVHGDFGLQFYAAAPLKTPDGFKIGVLAIADKYPREFSSDDEYLLESLAAIIMEELESK